MKPLRCCLGFHKVKVISRHKLYRVENCESCDFERVVPVYLRYRPNQCVCRCANEISRYENISARSPKGEDV